MDYSIKHSNRKANMNDIARALGISKASVSFALNGSTKVSEDTRKKVFNTAKKLGYKKNPMLSAVLSNLKSNDSGRFFGTIAIINANSKRDAFKRYPIFAKYVNGVKEQSQKLGFSTFEVWLHSPNFTPAKLKQIFEARGIRGALILGHTQSDIFTPEYMEVLRNFKLVSIGVKVKNSNIDCVCADKFRIAYHAMSNVLALGYKRPALVLSEEIDSIVEGRFSGGFMSAQLQLAEKNRIPPFLKLNLAIKKPKIFSDYIAKYKPDVILSFSEHTNESLERINAKIPSDIAQIRLESSSEINDWKAIDLNYEAVGATAMKQLADYINRPLKSELNDVSLMIIISPKWASE